MLYQADSRSGHGRYLPAAARITAVLLLLSVLFTALSCRPVTPTSTSSGQISQTGDTTATESGHEDTSESASGTSQPTNSDETSEAGQTTTGEPATETSDEESSDTETSESQTVTVDSSTTTVRTTTSGTTAAGTTATSTTRATTTRSATPTRGPTATNTPTPTQAQPIADNFPYKNYGAFFRDDYGRSNTQITEANGGQVRLDTGSAPNGVVLVRASSSLIGSKELIVVISANGQSYQYTVPDRDRYAGIPLNMGNGAYKIQILEATPVPRAGGGFDLVGTVLMNHTFSVSLASSLKPFTASSVKNDFSRGSAFVQKANELTSGITSADGKVSAIYTWIVNNISYDADLAKKVNDANLNNEYITHVADPAKTYSSRKGICDDYSALMSAMLRSQGIPTRIIYGHVTLGGSSLYHAWNEVFFEGQGWVVVASFSWREINGSGWVRFDSTFAASGSSPESIRDRNPPREKIY